MTITRTAKKAKSPWGPLGLLALLICANFSLIYKPPRDMIFPDRVKIKFTISQMAFFIE
jgi:hypothetical protein